MGFDATWLLAIRARIEADRPWEDEVATFLTGQRTVSRSLVTRYQRTAAPSAMTNADVDDILVLADARFVHEGILKYNGDASPRTYYFTIVVNAARNFYRPAWRRREVGENVLRTPDGLGPSPIEQVPAEDDHARAEMRRAVADAMRELYRRHPDLAEAVTLSLFENVTAEEAIARLGLTSPDAFHQRVHRGKVFLRRLLERLGWRR